MSTSSRWRRVGDIARRALLQAQGCQSAEQSNRNGCRRTGAATSRDAGTNTDFHGEARRGWERVDGGLQQRVAGDPGRPRHEGVPVAEGLHVEHHGVRASRRADRNLHSRCHRDVQDPSRPPEPCVGPPTVVTDPDRSRHLDHGSAPRRWRVTVVSGRRRNWPCDGEPGASRSGVLSSCERGSLSTVDMSAGYGDGLRITYPRDLARQKLSFAR